MKIKFMKDVFYRGEKFASEGEIKEVSEDLGFAQRWIKRGHVEVKEESIKEIVEDCVKEAVKETVSEFSKDIDKMKKAELIELAESMGIEIDASLKVKEIRDLLKEKLEVVDEIL
jgi:predicted peroxiredoxin